MPNLKPTDKKIQLVALKKTDSSPKKEGIQSTSPLQKTEPSTAGNEAHITFELQSTSPLQKTEPNLKPKSLTTLEEIEALKNSITSEEPDSKKEIEICENHYPSEDPHSSTQLFANQNFSQDRIHARISYFLKTTAWSFAFLVLLITGGWATISSSLAFGLVVYYSQKLSKTSQLLSRSQQGEDAEIKIAKLLKQEFKRANTQIFSIDDGNRLFAGDFGDLDILLILPSGKLFAISVKSLISARGNPVKVFYDPKYEVLRYRKHARTGKENFKRDPINELKQQTDWLFRNRREYVPNHPVEILVFAEPAILDIHKDTPTKQEGANAYFKQNGVYVVEEKNLVTLIKRLDRQASLKKHPRKSKQKTDTSKTSKTPKTPKTSKTSGHK